MDKLVSVIVPVYNAARFLPEAVESVLGQSYKNLELILVDDGSTDGSYALAKSYEERDGRVCVIRNEKNCGVAQTRNRGIAAASGDYIALLDSDDVWVEDKLERQLHLLEESRAQIAYCSYDFIDEQGKPVHKPFIVPKETNWDKMLVSSVISCSTILVAAAALAGHSFHEGYYHEDYVLWMELLAVPCKAVGDPAVLAHYRQVSGQRSGNKLHAAKQRWIVFRDVLHLGFWKRLNAFMQYAVRAAIKYYG